LGGILPTSKGYGMGFFLRRGLEKGSSRGDRGSPQRRTSSKAGGGKGRYLKARGPAKCEGVPKKGRRLFGEEELGKK